MPTFFELHMAFLPVIPLLPSADNTLSKSAPLSATIQVNKKVQPLIDQETLKKFKQNNISSRKKESHNSKVNW